MAEQGSIAITARGDQSRWYGRVSIPAALAGLANITPGMRISARCANGHIIIMPDENGRIRFPPTTGKTSPRHAFEAATTTLGLIESALPQRPAQSYVKDGKIYLSVPDEYIAVEQKSRKRARKDENKSPPQPPKPILTPVQGIYGASAAVVIEANRAGRKVRPMELKDVLKLLTDCGQTVKILGPRLFSLNEKTATIPDLLEKANKLTEKDNEGTIILEMK